MAASQGVHPIASDSRMLDRMGVAGRVLETGRQQQALRAAIASIVRASQSSDVLPDRDFGMMDAHCPPSAGSTLS